MRLIDGDALMDIYANRLELLDERYWPDSSECGVLSGAMMLLASQPTIEERKTGKWIELDSDEERYDEIMCPHCRRNFTVDAYHWTDIGFTKSDLKFCPNCGCDMRG